MKFFLLLIINNLQNYSVRQNLQNNIFKINTMIQQIRKFNTENDVGKKKDKNAESKITF